MSQLRLLMDGVLDFLYPPIDCVCCGKRLEKRAIHGICKHCHDNMPFIHEPKCTVCSRPVNDETEVCLECKYHRHSYDQALAVFEYSVVIKDLIHRYKYGGEYSLSRTFGFFLSEQLQVSGWKVDLMIPVPLHTNRQKSRGFNQSALLGDYLSQRNRIPCKDDVLVRSIDTQTQTGFNRDKRAENLKDAFTVVDPQAIKNESILIIDDVHTTGATVDGCSRMLRQAGARKIYVLTIATVVLE
ncbi:MAG: ComF family protein [Clostridiales bacterium]|nr:ComF family protein [Clostridiales bacterium]